MPSWYETLYGPFGSQPSDALPLDYIPIYNGVPPQWSGQGGPGAPADPTSIGPTVGTPASSTAAQAAQAVAAGISAVVGMPGLGLVASMPTVANMLGLQSSIGHPSIATVDVNEPGLTANQVQAAIAAQQQAAANMGIGEVASQPGPPGTTAETDQSVGNPAGVSPTAGNTDGSATGVSSNSNSSEDSGYAEGGPVDPLALEALFRAMFNGQRNKPQGEDVNLQELFQRMFNAQRTPIQQASVQGGSVPWAQGRSRGDGGLDFIDPEGRRLPAEHPMWRDSNPAIPDDPWGLDAWTDRRERDTGRRIPRTWKGEDYAEGGSVPSYYHVMGKLYG